jgi:hypothetical protein
MPTIREAEPVQREVTPQEVFDLVARHLLVQGQKSIIRVSNSRSKCAYRGDDGLKCAIGALISDEVYYDGLELLGANTFTIRKALWESGINPDADGMQHLLHTLQGVHDEWTASSWAGVLIEVGIRLGLDCSEIYTVLNELGYTAQSYCRYTQTKNHVPGTPGHHAAD